jgi:hypothetical protein
MASTKTDTSTKRPVARFPAARIKRIMQDDDNVGKIAAPVPPMVSRAAELFLKAVADACRSHLDDKATSTITPGHLKAALEKEPRFAFLAPVLDSIEDEPQGPPKKKKKTE